MIQIRNATLEDCLGIAHVQVDSYRTAYAGLFPQSYLDNFTYEEETQDRITLLKSGVDDILLVALQDENRVIGYALARAKSEIYPGYDAEIVAMHVRQTAQRQGIGSMLFQRCSHELHIRGATSVMLWTLKANPVRHWYEKLGGQFLGERTSEVDEWDITSVAYGWKPLLVIA